MNLHHGDMWNAWTKSDLFLITANSHIKRNGCLVMGAGIARQARDRFPGLDRALGAQIRKSNSLRYYGLLVSPRWPEAKLGLFQVKQHWSTKAKPDLIRKSARALYHFALNHPDKRIDLNFPGIGNGKLDVEDVWPLVAGLPDNVHIWTRYPIDIPTRGSYVAIDYGEEEKTRTRPNKRRQKMTRAQAEAQARQIVAESARRQAQILRDLGW